MLSRRPSCILPLARQPRPPPFGVLPEPGADEIRSPHAYRSPHAVLGPRAAHAERGASERASPSAGSMWGCIRPLMAPHAHPACDPCPLARRRDENAPLSPQAQDRYHVLSCLVWSAVANIAFLALSLPRCPTSQRSISARMHPSPCSPASPAWVCLWLWPIHIACTLATGDASNGNSHAAADLRVRGEREFWPRNGKAKQPLLTGVVTFDSMRGRVVGLRPSRRSRFAIAPGLWAGVSPWERDGRLAEGEVPDRLALQRCSGARGLHWSLAPFTRLSLLPPAVRTLER